MKKENGASIVALIIVIVIIVAIIGIVIYKLFGNDGIVPQQIENDVEYNKTEIVEKLNLIVKEKYVLDYKYASENNQKIEDIYSADTVIKYLLDSNYIEQLKDVNDNLVENQYFINASALNSDIATNLINENGSSSNGTKVFKIKKLEEKYMIYFVNKYGEEEELGELVMNPEV